MVNKKPIVCSRCGKRVGFVSLKLRLKLKLIAIAGMIAVVTQILAQIASDAFFRFVV